MRHARKYFSLKSFERSHGIHNQFAISKLIVLSKIWRLTQSDRSSEQETDLIFTAMKNYFPACYNEYSVELGDKTNSTILNVLIQPYPNANILYVASYL